MVFCFPSTKLLAAVHVGTLSGVGRRSDHAVETERQSNYQYELHGAALDVCRQIVTEMSAVAELTAPFIIKVTKAAVDDDGGRGWESVTLVEDSSSCSVVSQRCNFRPHRMHSVGKPSATGQPTRPTKPFIFQRSIKIE